jgi:hypothetical protein
LIQNQLEVKREILTNSTQAVEDSSAHSNTNPRDGILGGTNLGQNVQNSRGVTAEDSSGYGDIEAKGGTVRGPDRQCR